MRPSEVRLWASPWVSGTRAAAYFGPVSIELFVPGTDPFEWEKAQTELLEMLKLRTAVLGGNAVVGMEVSLDPFAEQDGARGLRLSVLGTAARLESYP